MDQLTNKIKGDNYEIFCKNYVKNVLKYDCYMWNDAMRIDNIIIKIGLATSHEDLRIKRKEGTKIFQDNGIDLIAINNDQIIAIQCKCGYEKGLSVKNLSGFFMLLYNYKFDDQIVFYTSRLSCVVKQCNQKIKFIQLSAQHAHYDRTIDANGIKNMMLNVQSSIMIKDKIIARDYQINCKDCVLKYWINNKNAIIQMPCGTGKTLLSYMISNNFNKVIFLSPLRQFAISCKNEYINYGCDKNNCMLISTDGDRDSDHINEFIKQEKWLLFVCYKSIDVICDIILNDPSILVIIDEMHNLSENNIYDEDNEMYKILNSENKCLLMSATPKLYIDDDMGEENDTIGEIVYKMEFNQALRQNIITDYLVLLPSVHRNMDNLNQQIINELNIDEIYDIDIYHKCQFYIECMRNKSFKKTIFYCNSIEEVNKYYKILNMMMKDFNYYDEYEIQIITSEISGKVRKQILHDFETSNKVNILLSIKILNECVNIISCDSIYMTHVSNNICTGIQRMCRSIRKDVNNKNKTAYIMMWCNEYNEIANMICGLKEYDCDFDKDCGNTNNEIKGKIQIIDEFRKIDEYDNVNTVNKYIIGMKEYRSISWFENLKKVKEYIDCYDKRPSAIDKDKDVKFLGIWLSKQQYSYKLNERIMVNVEIRKEYEQFITEYSEYLISNDKKWNNTLIIVKKYIDKYNKTPSNSDKDKDIKCLGSWLSVQQRNYKTAKYSMSNVEIRKEYEQFITEYSEYLISNDKKWNNTLIIVKKYINKYGKRPSEKNKNNNIKCLGSWLSVQQRNYKTTNQIMVNAEIRKEYEQFITEYSEYF